MENDLYDAAKKGDIKGMADILNTGFDVDTPSTNRHGLFPAIIAAAKANQYEAVEFLIMRGASVNPENTLWDSSPLLEAQYNRASADLTKLLLDQNAIVDYPSPYKKDSFYITALFVASTYKNVENIKLLLEAQADCTMAGKNARSTLSFATDEMPSLLPLFEPYLKKNK